MPVATSQYEISGKNHVCSVKTFSPRALSTRQRKKILWNKQHFGMNKRRVLPTLSNLAPRVLSYSPYGARERERERDVSLSLSLAP